MPSRRSNGTLVFKFIVYGPSISENVKVVNWIAQEREGVNIEQLSMGHIILKSAEYYTSKDSSVVFQFITIIKQQGHKPNYLIKGVDGILFTWDSLLDQWENNVEILEELLRFYGVKLLKIREIPTVVLASKRDREDIVKISKIRQVLDTARLNHVLIYETIVDQGINVKRAFVYLSRQVVLNHYKRLVIDDYKCPFCYSSISRNQAERFMDGEIIQCKYCDVEFNEEFTSLTLDFRKNISKEIDLITHPHRELNKDQLIKGYLRDIHINIKTPLDEKRIYNKKVIVWGSGGVGKKTLLHRYIDGVFDSSYGWLTKGVEYYTKNYHFEEYSCKFVFWVLGGQERWRFFQRDFCKGADCCLLLCDLTRPMTFEDLDEFIPILHANKNNFPILLVGTKKDLKDEISIDIINNKVKIIRGKWKFHDYIETSAKLNYNINYVFDLLFEMIFKQKSISYQ